MGAHRYIWATELSSFTGATSSLLIYSDCSIIEKCDASDPPIYSLSFFFDQFMFTIV